MEALRAGFYLEDGTLDLKDASDGLRNQGHKRNLNVEDLQISQLDRQLFDDACHVLRHSVWIRRTVTKCFSCAVHFWGDVFMTTKTTSLASTDPEDLGQDQYEYESSSGYGQLDVGSKLGCRMTFMSALLILRFEAGSICWKHSALYPTTLQSLSYVDKETFQPSEVCYHRVMLRSGIPIPRDTHHSM